MEPLRGTILSLRCESSDPRSPFVPEGSLDKIITTAAIKAALRESGAHLHRESEHIKLIRQDGKKTFAILVCMYKADLIVNFIEDEQLQKFGIDSKLPYSNASDLEKILPKIAAVDFFEKQWDYTVPVFRRRAGHRRLYERTIFPVLESDLLGEGSFGKIYKEKLHGSHITADFVARTSSALTVVRKELKATHPYHSEDFGRECQVLSFLNYLDHPNIVELLGSYTYRGTHSLIFPVAEYDLNTLLKSPPSLSFKSQSDYLLALCGLASALDKLHSFSSDMLGISLIGCHHDIKPQNILVQDGQFLLADFGLATLTEVSKGSKPMSKMGDSRYRAPEREDWDNGFQPGAAGRKSDIWSFGCVISELATYIIQGHDGVKVFEQSRQVAVNSKWTGESFHAGRKPNKRVEAWLTALDENATAAFKGLTGLVRQMLQMEPKDRPDSLQVTWRLRFWTLESKFSNVQDALSYMVRHRQDLNMMVEKERLLSWAQTTGIMKPASYNGDTDYLLTADNTFNRTFRHLKMIEEQVTSSTELQDDFHASYTRLRMINDEIVQSLPSSVQVKINSLLEQKLVSTDDLGFLQKIRQNFDEDSQYRSIGTLAAVKYMHQLCQAPADGHGRRMQLKSVSQQPHTSFDHFKIEELCAEGRHPTLALIEEVEYEENWVDRLGNELFDRIGAVLELLRTASRSDKEMRLLSPIGWFHEPQNRKFKMAFNIPKSIPENNSPQVTTLRQYMEANDKHTTALEDRFVLARRLAGTLSRLHKVKWLHKNISSFSIVFSLPLSYPPSHAIPPPYLVGFNYSRPDDPNSWSKMPEYSVAVTDYCHPEYLKQARWVRYQPRFDWYSLGLVLLEIGLWRTLGSMMRGTKPGLPPEELRERVLLKFVPQLDFYMGRGYGRVVRDCIEGHVGVESGDDGGAMQSVEEQLRQCSL
ncbi:MAG: hypothetical protein LQ352_007006 [Teloschistes flavicans]|nr:MAG: hypothetical protein LQ352_007006 [Teloschistes flavicans]